MRRHPFDPVSMVLGALFTVIGVAFLFGDVNVANLPPALTWPVPLVVVGLAVISLALSGSRSARRDLELEPGLHTGQPLPAGDAMLADDPDVISAGRDDLMHVEDTADPAP
jgi:drug/metabolite transporter (DMT)-like permease